MKRKGAVKVSGLFFIGIVLMVGVTSTAEADWSRVNVGGGSLRRHLFDVNNDGHLDSISTTHWWRNSGDRGGNWQSFSIGNIDYPNPDARIVDDVSGDGLVDLVIGVGRVRPAPYRNRIYAFINPGTTGTWARLHIGTLPDAPDGVETVAIGDMDRDGHPDILAGGQCSELWWFINPGQMTGPWSHRMVADFGVDVEGMVIAHFNEDLFLDIAVTTCHPQGLWGGTYVLINPQTRVGNWRRITVDSGRFSAIESIAAGDINRDGRTDVILSNNQPFVNSYLFWYEQPITGTAWSRRTIDTLSTEHLKGSLPGVADINLDGIPDVIVYRHSSLTTYWHKNPGGGGGWVRHRIIGMGIGGEQGEFAIGDVDNDRDSDIIGGEFWYVNPSPNTVPIAPPPALGGGGCFIATAAFGTPMAEEVEVLSRFRDQHLLTNELGRRFVFFYYQHSPALVEYISDREWAKKLARITLKPLLWSSRLVIKD